MSLNVEQKLKLTKEIRQKQLLNRQEMYRREELVYGFLPGKKRKENPFYAAESEGEEAAGVKTEKRKSGLIFRSFVAVILLTVFLLMKYQNIKIGDLNYRLLISSLQSTEFIKGIDFETLFPYTEESETESEIETE